MPLTPVVEEPTGTYGTLTPVAEEPDLPTIKDVDRLRETGQRLTDLDLRALFKHKQETPLFSADTAQRMGKGAGQAWDYLSDTVGEGVSAIPGLLGPHKAPKAATTLTESAVRGTYDLGNIGRMALRKGWDAVAGIGETDEEKYQRFRARHRANEDWNELREEGVHGDGYLLPWKGLPEWARPDKEFSEMGSLVLDPTVALTGGLGAGAKVPAAAAMKGAGRTATRAVVKGTGKVGTAVRAAGEAPQKVVKGVVRKVVGEEAAQQAEKAVRAGETLAVGAAFIGAPGAKLVGAAAGAKWAGGLVERAAEFGTRLVDAAPGTQMGRFAQIARDPTAPGWMRLWGTLGARAGRLPGVELSQSVGKGSMTGAAIGGGLGALSAESPEEFGAAAATGAMLGAGTAGGMHPLTMKQRAMAKKLGTIARFATELEAKGISPETMAKVGDTTMLQGAILSHVFEGLLDIRFLDAEAYNQSGPPKGSGAYWNRETRQLYVNVESSRGADLGFLHEAGHALSDSEVANNPQIKAEIDKLLGRGDGAHDPQATAALRLERAKRGYAESLVRSDKANVLRGTSQKPTKAEIDAKVAELDADSLATRGDPNHWIYSEIFAESVMGNWLGKDLWNDVLMSQNLGPRMLTFGQRVLEGMGVRFSTKHSEGGTPTFFAHLDDVIDSPALRKMTDNFLRARHKHMAGKSAPVEQRVPVTRDMYGRHPGVPVHRLDNGEMGDDFVVVNDSGLVIPRTRAQTRRIERARAAEVESSLTDQPPVGPDDTSAEVRPRRTITGLVQYTGTKLGDWFYNLRSFSPEHKGNARFIEASIDAGQTVDFYYQAVYRTTFPGGRRVQTLHSNLAVSERNTMPMGFLVTRSGWMDVNGKRTRTGGNVLMYAMDLGRMNQRLSEWQGKQGPLSLEQWQGDVNAFQADLRTYLENHAEGRPGEAGIGEQKKNACNAFVLGDHRAYSHTNPLRDMMRGRDKEGMIRSFRLDRITAVEQARSQPHPAVEYNKKVLNATPEGAEYLRNSPALHPDVDARVEAQQNEAIPPGLEKLLGEITNEDGRRPDLLKAHAEKVSRERGSQASPDIPTWNISRAQQVQRRTSGGTDLGQIPATLNKVKWQPNTRNADIGGGRSEKFTEALKAKGVENIVMDPVNRDPAHNKAAISRIRGGQADTATVNNVLNVIKEPAVRDQVIRQAADAVKDGGEVYFKIYEGNGSGKGAPPPNKSDQWQNNRKANRYRREIRRHFSDVSAPRNQIITAKNPKVSQVDRLNQAMPDSPDPIRSAAMRDPNTGRIFEGPMHALAVEVARAEMGDDTRYVVWDEGFMTESGEFLTREEAYIKAEKEGSMSQSPAAAEPDIMTDEGQGTRLISEFVDELVPDQERVIRERYGEDGVREYREGRGIVDDYNQAMPDDPIRSAAIRRRGTDVVHEAPMHAMAYEDAGITMQSARLWQDGFVTRSGKFLTREEAYRVADRTDQIENRERSERVNLRFRQTGMTRAPILLAEDMPHTDAASGAWEMAKEVRELTELQKRAKTKEEKADLQQQIDQLRKDEIDAEIERDEILRDTYNQAMPDDPIRSAAMRHPRTGKIYEGAMHAMAIEVAAAELGDVARTGIIWDEGFMTESGKFLTREEAYQVAEQADTISAAGRGPQGHLDLGEGPRLMSEFADDLAPQQEARIRKLYGEEGADGVKAWKAMRERVDQYNQAMPDDPIRSAAIRKGGTIHEGPMHALAYEDAGIPWSKREGWEDGFVTKSGKFLTREEAFRVVDETNDPNAIPERIELRRNRTDTDQFDPALDSFDLKDTHDRADRWQLERDRRQLEQYRQQEGSQASPDLPTRPAMPRPAIPELPPRLPSKVDVSGEGLKPVPEKQWNPGKRTDRKPLGETIRAPDGSLNPRYEPNLDPRAFPVELLFDKDGKPVTDDNGKSKTKGIQYRITEAPAYGLKDPPPEYANDILPDRPEFKFLNPTERRKLSYWLETGAIDRAADLVEAQYNEWGGNKDIMQGRGWYKRMRESLRRIFKTDTETEKFTEMLGALSANTSVDLNFRYAVIAYEMFKAGEFDLQIAEYADARHAAGEAKSNAMAQFEKDLAAGKVKDTVKAREAAEDAAMMAALDKWTKGKHVKTKTPRKTQLQEGDTPASAMQRIIAGEGLEPIQDNGKRFGKNGEALLKVLNGNWLEDLGAPKTWMFSGNLSGRTLAATIDVWAARLMHRLGYEKSKHQWRIQPKSEVGVNNIDYFFSQLVFEKASERVGMNPDDLQAVVWFGEKAVWSENGWTTEAGADMSSFDHPMHIFYPGDSLTGRTAREGVRIQEAEATQGLILERLHLMEDPNLPPGERKKVYNKLRELRRDWRGHMEDPNIRSWMESGKDKNPYGPMDEQIRMIEFDEFIQHLGPYDNAERAVVRTYKLIEKRKEQIAATRKELANRKVPKTTSSRLENHLAALEKLEKEYADSMTTLQKAGEKAKEIEMRVAPVATP